MIAVYSLKWVESDPDENGFGGGGGAKWVDVGQLIICMMDLTEPAARNTLKLG
jgi:hypothetical protein